MGMNISDAVYPRLIRRVRAILIDSVFLLGVVLLWWITLPFVAERDPYIKVALPLILMFILESCMVAFTGGTPGHHIMGIKIVNARNGSYIGVARSLVRALFRTLLGWLSFIIALTSKRHQALHDLLVGTVVVFRNPAAYPSSERYVARNFEDQNYSYPPKWKRILLITFYNIAGFIVLIVGVSFVLSSECLEYDRCTFREELLNQVLGWAWLFYFGATTVMCWRGQLPGCRRIKLFDERPS